MGELTIAHMKFGSHVYGTNTPESDHDFKTIFIPDARDILLQTATKVSRSHSTGDPLGKNAADDVDVEEFSLHGYMKLLCEGQTVAVDMLFVPPQLIEQTSATWDFIRDSRKAFISRSIQPFVGYCRAQANKYGIKGSRMAAAKAAASELSQMKPKDFKLGDAPATIAYLVAEHPGHIEVVDIAHPRTGQVVQHLSVCGKKAPFTLQCWKAQEMYESLWQRYGDRARQAMNNEGIDWKALMHARRIQDQAIELLKTGEVEFPRPNAEALLQIRLGKRPYAEVASEIEQGMSNLEAAMEKSTLKDIPNRRAADAIVIEAYAAQVRGVLE